MLRPLQVCVCKHIPQLLAMISHKGKNASVIAGKYAGDLFCGELFFVNKKWRGGAESADKAGFVPLFEGKSKKRKAKVELKKSKKREWYYFSRKIDRHITVQLFCLSASGTWKFHSSTCVFSVILYLEYRTGSAVCCGISLGNPRGGSRDRSFPVCCGNWNPALCCHVAEESAQ